MNPSVLESWADYKEGAPDRVIEVIENGPFPLSDYGSSKLSHADKRRGMMRFKGGDGRGHVPVKSGQKAIVYFDADFAEGLENVPEHIEARHSRGEVIEAFTKM